MKNKVNVVKKIAFLMITVALAVALMACQGAVGKPGAKGDTGDTGAPGPAGETGPPGVSNNAPPMLKPGETLPHVYLALGGTGKMLTNDKTKLGSYFTDEESLTLGYEVDPIDANIASATVKDGIVTVTGKNVGDTTVTVTVYDNSNDPITETFSVTVVATNERPSVTSLSTPDDDKLSEKLFKSSGVETRTVSSTISAGVASGNVLDEVMFSFEVNGTSKVSDDVVEVSVDPGPGNTYDITITPVKSGSQKVEITATDIFGSPALVKLVFTASVNYPPKLTIDLPDKILNRTVAKDSSEITAFTYDISDYFDGEFVDDTVEGDTECTVSTDPPQPQPTDVTAAAMASVTVTDKTYDVVVNSADNGENNLTKVGNVSLGVPAAATGSFEITITCADKEASAHDTATIYVRE